MAEVALNGATLVAFAVVSTAVGIVMLADVMKRRVPNSLWVVFAISGILFHTFATVGQGLEFSLVGAFLGFGLLFMPFLAGGIATRDLKLMAGVGTWFGPSLTIWVFVCVAAAAGLYYALNHLQRRNFREGLIGLRVMYCRVACLFRYLAANDDAPYRPEESELDQRVVSYATAIFLSTLLMLNVIVLFWK